MFRFNLYIWILWLLCAGTFSYEDIDGCEHQPCQNSGVCESQNGGFRCLCSQQSQNGRLYGGETCTVALLGCNDNQCENGGICSPLLVDDQHTYTCICLAGFTGPKCQTSTVFSFESRGYMYLEPQLLVPEAPLNVTFSFRTGQPVGTLLQRRVDDLLLTVELVNGRLRLYSLRGQGSPTLIQELPVDVSNGQWHAVEASLGGVSLLKLLCTNRGCARDTSVVIQLLEFGSGLSEPDSVRQSLVIGAAGVSQGSGEAADGDDYPAAFRGCFRDVYVDSQLVVPTVAAEDPPTQVNVTVGCSDRDKCDDNPCQNRGHCVSQGWRSYACECHRPYVGIHCAEEYITARFGNKDLESYAVFSLDDQPGDTVAVSMFLRTRQPSGLLLVLANSTSQYLRLWLEEGKVKVQVNNFESLVGQSMVSDGHFHLVTVRLEGETVVLFHSSQNQGSASIRPAQVQFGDLVFVGGLPDQRASAMFGGYFKGCIQDLRIHSKRLQFYPIATPVESYSLEQLINVTQGCSSDNVQCIVNPCRNGGVCYSMWDDFACNCPPNTAGRQCEELKWCELSPCPSTAVCHALSHGFDCLSNITFGSDSGILSYRGNGKIKRSLCSVLLSIRTRQADATLLHAEKDSNYITLSLQESHLLLQLQAGGNVGYPKLTAQSPGPISDGEWHTVELSMENQDLQSSTWIMVLDGGREGTYVSNTSSGNLDFLREGVDIFLGGLGMEAGGNLAGCLGPVEIGGLPLPFYGDTELNLPRPQEEQFVRTASTAAPRYGCWGANVCEPNPCQNQGVCDDLFDLSQCRCPSGWAGPLCRDLTDSCTSSPCVHGNCTILSEGYRCVCELGYRGDRCESEIDTCEDNKCNEAAMCLRGFQHYACLCPQNTTGQYCEEEIPELPWYIEAIPIPELPVSECRGTKWNYSCFNGGKCSTVENSCDCPLGFLGQWCEQDVDECSSNPCMNGGTCLNYLNSYECVCDSNHVGQICQIDNNDFYLYIFLCYWQNVLQVLSYLIFRVSDDDPEIEWDFQDDD